MSRVIEVSAQSGFSIGSRASAVEMNLEVTPQTDAEINRLAEAIGGTKLDALAWGLALLSLAVEARTRGDRLAVVDATGHVAIEITGL